MSKPDHQFDAIVDQWMRKRAQLWSLHDAICLLQKIDPSERTTPIAADIEDGKTNRAMTFVKDAFNDPDHWFKPQITIKDADLSHASSYKVSKRAFVRWATNDWPYEAGHLERGLKQYEKLRKRTKQQIEADERTSSHHDLFMDYFNSYSDPQGFHQMSDREIAKAIWDMARKAFPEPYSERTLRLRIKTWRTELKLPGPRVLKGKR